jgi:branched-chain amino acid transport system permease protein
MKIAYVTVAVVVALLPFHMSDFQSLVIYAGVAAIGGHRPEPAHRVHRAGVARPRRLPRGGGYTGAYVGGELDLPFLVWLPVAGLVSGPLIGAVIGPFALRLRGNYLAIVTLGLVFIGQHVFENWTSVTGRVERAVGHRAGRDRPARLRRPLDLRPVAHAGPGLLLPRLDPRRRGGPAPPRTS